MNKPVVFVDTDVLIASLLSSKGAAYLLLFHTAHCVFTVSTASVEELRVVTKRLTIPKTKVTALLQGHLKSVSFHKKVVEKYQEYVDDMEDAHIVAGAVKAKASFLISYNLRHFHANSLKADLGIVLLTPAKFLQYLRSLSLT